MISAILGLNSLSIASTAVWAKFSDRKNALESLVAIELIQLFFPHFSYINLHTASVRIILFFTSEDSRVPEIFLQKAYPFGCHEAN